MGSKPRAVIVGAGIAGLATAWWLDKAGWESVIVERSPATREGGYTVGLSGPGFQTLKRMNLVGKLEQLSHKFEENVISDNKGRELIRFRYEDVYGDSERMAVRRGDLAHVLREALPETASVVFDETVINIDDNGETVEVTLQKGGKLQATLVIGADGVHSEVRHQIWKDIKCLEHLGYSFAAYDVAGGKNLLSDCVSVNGPGHLNILYNLHNNRQEVLHIWRNRQGMHRQTQPYKLLRDITVGGPPIVSDVINRAENSGCTPIIDSLSMVILPSWSKGRIVLLGDSAHCLTLMSSQGACMALRSAEILSQELERAKDVPQALLNHERRLRPSIDRLQHRSRKMAQRFIPKSRLMYHFDNFMLRFIPYSWIVSWHANSESEEADLI